MDRQISRDERLQIMISEEELKLIDDWRFRHRMPSRAAAIRELIRLGLNDGGPDHEDKDKSSESGIVEEDE